jgi:hypothetical protein
MNLRSYNYTIQNDPNTNQEIIIQLEEGLTGLGIFLSSLLLSISGLFAVVCSSLRKSNCSTIKCGSCCEVQRSNLGID